MAGQAGDRPKLAYALKIIQAGLPCRRDESLVLDQAITHEHVPPPTTRLSATAPGGGGFLLQWGAG